MNISDLTSYMYALTGTDVTKTASTAQTTAGSSTSSTTATDTSDFASMLSSEISSLSATEGTTELEQLASVIDSDALNSMISNSTDLNELSQELLNSSSGRNLLSELSESHLENMVLTDSSDDDDSDSDTDLEDALTSTSYSDTVADTSDLLETLESLADTLNTSNGSTEE